MFCIVDQNDEIVDGAYGWAIGETESDAWGRALDPCQIWSIEKAKGSGISVKICELKITTNIERK